MTASAPALSSDHWNESALLVLGDGVRRGDISAALQDVAPTVLRALGAPIPPDMEGHVLPLWEPA